MKKKITIGLGIIILATVGVYAATNSSIISLMKAPEHSFTLANQLNAGESGLSSIGLKGKKEGGILTAKEYNRILEIIADDTGGGVTLPANCQDGQSVIYDGATSSLKCITNTNTVSGGSSGSQIDLNSTTPFNPECRYYWVTNDGYTSRASYQSTLTTANMLWWRESGYNSSIIYASNKKRITGQYSGTVEAIYEECPSGVATTTYSWHPGSWGSCSKTCGGGTKTRSVVCKDNSGNTVGDANCTSTKPATSQSCNTAACAVSYSHVANYALEQNGYWGGFDTQNWIQTISLGATASDRYTILTGTGTYNFQGNGTPPSIKIGNVTANVVKWNRNSDTVAFIAIADTSSLGTTATLTYDPVTTMVYPTASIYRVTGLSSATPVNTYGNSSVPFTVQVSGPAGAFYVWAGIGKDSNNTPTFSGITRYYNGYVDGTQARPYSAAITYSTAKSNFTMSQSQNLVRGANSVAVFK